MLEYEVMLLIRALEDILVVRKCGGSAANSGWLDASAGMPCAIYGFDITD